MSTINIGPCNCCGTFCNCFGTATWEYTTQSGPDGPYNFWEVVSPCSHHEENPCCEALIGDTITPEYNPLYWSPPVPIGARFTSPCRAAYGNDNVPGNENNRCNCTTCILTWDGFTMSWGVTSACRFPSGPEQYTTHCHCPPPDSDGDYHGQEFNSHCKCPS